MLILPKKYKEILKITPLIVPNVIGYKEEYLPIIDYTKCVIIDRTRTFLDCGYNLVIEDEIPTDIKWVGDFSTVCDKTAIEIENLSKIKNKPIGILYSGGLDSTCVLTAFLKNGIKVTVIYSEPCIRENDVFYNEVLKDNDLIIHELGNPFLFLYNNKDNYIFVTGECGAQVMGRAHIFGTNFATSYNKEDYVFSNENLVASVDQVGMDILKNPNPYFNLPDEIKSKLLLLYEKSPVPLKTNYDAQWWAIFVLKWQAVKYRIQMWTGTIYENYINFFLTDDFQMWTLTNDATVKCPNFDWKNYKMPMKDYIYSYCPHKEASYAIPKRRSASYTYENLTLKAKYVLADPKKVVCLSKKQNDELLDTLKLREVPMEIK